VIVVVDYGLGNLGSILNMLERLGIEARLSEGPASIREAHKLILPGVGAFGEGMEQLVARGLVEPLRHKVLEEHAPILGICLGLHLMARHSEEGGRAGLGWLDADVVRFKPPGPGETLKIPHMGWNLVEARKPSPLLRDLPQPARFYFVHAYHVVAERSEDVLLETRHGRPFASALERGNIRGVQFHPEKSHRFGMTLLGNFARHC
jgi:glutamine amidotransferase